MTKSVRTVWRCDGDDCGETLTTGLYAAEATGAAGEAGWTIGILDDRCPRCSAACSAPVHDVERSSGSHAEGEES